MGLDMSEVHEDAGKRSLEADEAEGEHRIFFICRL